MSRIATALLCGAIALTPTLGLADADATLEKLVVEMAETPQQHAALVRYYQARAKDARAEASRHQRMSGTYQNAKLAQRKHMSGHCEKISERYTSMAKEYEELARLHEKEA